jgi:cellulose synthase operon protein C
VEVKRFFLVAAMMFSTVAQAATTPERVPSATSMLSSRKRDPGRPFPDRDKLIAEKRKGVDAKRLEAIKLLEEILAARPQRETEAEALFKLAELYWEDSRLRYLLAMDSYDRRMARCRQDTDTPCPPMPSLDIGRSERLYKRLAERHPTYPRSDLVLYLLGFAAHEDGRGDEALQWLERVVAEHPTSPVLPDAWMMIGEHHFQSDFAAARAAYLKVLEHKSSPVYDLALFKTAWCDWKLGDTKRAAERFKEVLDLATEAEKAGTVAQKKRSVQLRDEALDYLTLLFTEDESVTAADAYSFLASIGGQKYSREVLGRLADTFHGQARYDRAVEAWELLINKDPRSLDAPQHQLRIVDSYMQLGDTEKALAGATELAKQYGEKSAWARANKARPDVIKKIAASVDETLFGIAQRLHAEAQEDEKARKRADARRFKKAADFYGVYLERFGDKPGERPVEARFLRAEILYYKLGQHEAAGDEYLAVGRSEPMGKRHNEALLKAMEAFEKLRPKKISSKDDITPADRKFAEAVQLYAKHFPADPKLVGVLFRNGEMFFQYGAYDDAVKQFGQIVTKYPDDPNAGPAGDRIIEALVKGEDYATVEEWARKLMKARSFQGADQQTRLSGIIVQSIGKRGEGHAKAERWEDAAKEFRRAADEFPKFDRSNELLFNAGVMLEAAKQPVRAAETYLAVVERYPKAKNAPDAAFAAGRSYEQLAYFDEASRSYGLIGKHYPDAKQAADALYNVGVLEQALGRPQPAIAANLDYVRRFPKRADIAQVLFRTGVVYADAKDHAKAIGAFHEYIKRYPEDAMVMEAHVRAARSAIAMKDARATADELARALKRWKGLGKKITPGIATWAAEARYLQGEAVFEEYAAIGLDVKPDRLRATLEKKKALLARAQEIYTDAVTMGDPRWATASLFRIGQIYEHFADALRTTPAPAGLSEEQGQAFRDEIDTYVVDIEEKAIDVYTKGYAKAIDLKVYGTYTRLLREGLGRLASNRFPPENEARVRARVGDKAPEPQLQQPKVSK